MSTILNIIADAAAEIGISSTVSTVVGNTDATVTQLKALLNREGKELRRQFLWPELLREHVFSLTRTQDSYDLPVDFDSNVFDSFWDRANSWQLLGPMSAQEAQARTSGIISSSLRRRYRITGGGTPQGGRVQIFDAPSSSEAGDVYALNYQTKSWLAPATEWALGDSITSGDVIRCHRDGSTYTAQANGTAGGTPTSISQGTSTASYSISDVTTLMTIKNTGGQKAYYALGTDNTVTATASDTSIAAGETIYVARSTSQTYIAFIADASTTLQIYNEPVHSGYQSDLRDGYSDGVKWRKTTYETISLDTDIALLDPELLTLGVIWRFLRSKNMDYNGYFADYKQQITKRVGAITGARTITMGRSGVKFPFISTANIPDTNYGS